MPYSGADDPSLPSNIKKLPAKKRAQFAAVFNSALSGGASESSAFAQANGTVNKEITQCSEFGIDGHICSAKCGPEEMVSRIAPMGGATTFDEADTFAAAAELEEDAGDLWLTFTSVLQNISANEDMTVSDKATAVKQAADDYGARLQQLDLETGDEGGKSWMDRLKSALGSKAAWTSAYVNNLSDSAFAVIDSGGKKDDQGKTTPRSLRHYPHHDAAGKVDLPHLRNALARAAQNPNGKAAMGHLEAHAKAEKIGGRELGGSLSSFTVTKDLHGADRWVALVSNRYYDREGEVFPEAAHLEYVSYIDASKDYPELWLWHTPGSRIGQADFIEYADGFLMASGTFDAKAAKTAAWLRNMRKELGVSHGFGYLEEHLTDEGAYTQYRTFEISPLPRDKAANPWTAFGVEEVQLMGMNKEKRAFLVGALGEEPVARIEAELPAFAKALQERGVQFKDVLDAIDEEPKPEGNGGGDAPEGDAPEGDESEGEGAPESADAPEGGEEPVTAGTLAQITGALTSLATAIPLIQTSVAEISERVKALERSDDEKLAAKMSPRRPAPTTEEQRPSTDEKNIIPDDLAKKIFGDEEKEPAMVGSSAQLYAQDLLNGANHISRDQ